MTYAKNISVSRRIALRMSLSNSGFESTILSM